MPVPRETSKRITSLRFLLAMLVVFIHNNFTAEQIRESIAIGGRHILFNQSIAGVWIQRFISGGIASATVPLFFLFAAYLQAMKNDPYKIMLKKKSRSLLVPYILWIAIGFLYFGIGKLAVLKIAPAAIARPDKTLFTMTAHDWVAGIIGFVNKEQADGNPLFAMQFWFVRDLLILTLVSPLLVRLIKKFPAGFFAITVFFFFDGHLKYDAHIQTAFFYYIVGLYWGIYDIPIFENIDRVHWGEVALLFLLSFLSHYTYPSYFVTASCMTLTACAVLLKCSKAISENETLFSTASYFAGFSFFLFAVHMPILNYVLQKIWLHFLPMKNGFFCLAEYFGVNILTIATGTGIGIALKKCCPPVFSILNGGRK
ncbi:MAG: acyltransferase [Treponemataceae bacterium]|nr:acyltransferase [Treponemataceae bacterium]